MAQDKDWDLIITSKPKGINLGISELWNYKDLVLLFVKRDFVSQYKQSLLGPLWFILQPLITTLVFSIILGGILGKSTGIPYPIFTLSGLTIWNFFSSMIGKTSNTFVANASIFGKVYFPRLTVPLSAMLSNYVSFLIQFLLFITVMFYYKYFQNFTWEINFGAILLLPWLLIIFSFLGLGIGLIVSSATTKYRDLSYLIGFGLQLWMYASAIIISLDNLPEKIQRILEWNPAIPIINSFRYIFLNYRSELFSYDQLIYPSVVSILFLFIGLAIFNRVEKSFTDTV
jgi:lipopolysaccharide transport system permease protein